MIRRIRIPPLVRVASPVVMILWLGISLMYHAGAEGVSTDGADLSFEREYDYRLFKVARGYAIQVSRWEMEEPTIVQYESCIFPFSWLCGRYEGRRIVLLDPLFKKGDLIVSGKVGFEGHYALNTKTNTLYRTQLPDLNAEPNQSRYPDFQFASLYEEIGFDPALDAHNPITVEEALNNEERPELSVSQESCIVFNIAFLCIWGLMLFAILVSTTWAYFKERSIEPETVPGGD